LGIFAILGVRAGARLIGERREQGGRTTGAATAGACIPTLLIGAGGAGALAAKEIGARPASGIRIVGFLDENENLTGMTVEGHPVLGTTRDLKAICQRHGVQQAIITIANAPVESIRRLVQLCKSCNLPTKIIPPLHEIVEGRIHLGRIHEVSIDDLLRRSPARLGYTDADKIVRDRSVLVTGAGGSIGSA